MYTSVYPLLLCKIGVGGGLNHIGLFARFSDVCTRFEICQCFQTDILFVS